MLLRDIDFTARDEAALAGNVQYLLLRFLGERVTDDDDPRLAPWMRVLTLRAEDATEPLTDLEMARRWEAVCIGLATHPDFLTY